MYAENLTCRRLGGDYLVITGYLGEVKKTLPVQADTLRQFIQDATATLELMERNTNGVIDPPSRGRKPRAKEMPSKPFYGADGELLPTF